MARQGQQAASAADSQNSAEKAVAYNNIMKYSNQFENELAKLRGGTDIAANPFKNPDYLRNQNILTSTVSSATNNQLSDQMKRASQRTGENSAGLYSSMRDLGRQLAQAKTAYQAGQYSTDYDKNLLYQQQMLNNILAPANAQAGIFGAATSGQSNDVNALVNEDAQNSAMWGNIIGGIAGGAGSAFQGKA